MKSNINQKKQKNIMKYGFIFLLSLLLFGNVFAQDQIALKYEYEEGLGQIIFDSSGNGFDAVNTNANWVTPSAFGTYGLEFDGGSDYIETTIPLGIPKFTIGSWVYPYQSTTQDTIVEIGDGINQHFELLIQGGSTRFNYIDDTNTPATLILKTGNIPQNQYTHISFSIDSTTESYQYYENGLLVSNGNFPNGYKSFVGTSTARIGSDFGVATEFLGILDSTFLLNFIATQEQITQMIQQNTITILPPVVEEEDILAGYEDTTLIIDDYLPFQNAQITPLDFLNINLNARADCDFYVDSKLYKSGENQTAYSWSHDLEIGNYKGSFYCDYVYEGIRYYQLISSFPFEVVQGNPTLVQFQINALDFSLENTELWVTSPCLEEGFSAIGTDYKPYRPQYNPDGAYFSKVINGVAIMNITSGKNEFCLHNGRIIANENNKTTNYDVVEAFGVLKLGNIDIPSNQANYKINVNQFDIYPVYDPKAYGKTFSEVMGGLILVLFGGLICIAGIKLNNGKIVVAGALVFMAGFGIGVNGLLGIII